MNRVVLGYDNGVFKARVTKPGFNVLTETNIQNFSLHEAYPSAAIYLAGSASHPIGAPMLTIGWPTLTYIPMAIILLQQTTTNFAIGVEQEPDSGIRLYNNRLTIPANSESSPPPIGRPSVNGNSQLLNWIVHYYIFTQQGQ